MELKRPVHDPVIGERNGGHLHLYGVLDEVFDLDRAV
jgi:hypothetical protein